MKDIAVQVKRLEEAYDPALQRSADDRPTWQSGQVQFRALCRSMIRPAMAAAAGMLRPLGHRVAIVERDLSVTPGGLSLSPEITLYLSLKGTVKRPEWARHDYRMAFVYDLTSGKLLAQVSDRDGNRIGHEGPLDRHPIEGVTGDLIEEELLEMLRCVFERERRMRVGGGVVRLPAPATADEVSFRPTEAIGGKGPTVRLA